jgi:hypothetical protein
MAPHGTFVVACGAQCTGIERGEASLSAQQHQMQQRSPTQPGVDFAWQLATTASSSSSSPTDRRRSKLTLSLSKHAPGALRQRGADQQHRQPRRPRAAVASLTVSQGNGWPAAGDGACCASGSSGSGRPWWSPFSPCPRQQPQQSQQSQRHDNQQRQQQRQPNQHEPPPRPPAAAVNLTSSAMAADALAAGAPKALHTALLENLEHGKLLIAGAMSAVVSRTAVAPLERVGRRSWLSRLPVEGGVGPAGVLLFFELWEMI